ncbi:hypothetical protein CsSME_00047261 [Camellia sinensis var. sinensis]
MSQAMVEAFQSYSWERLPHMDQMKELMMKTAPLDKIDVQALALTSHLVEDDQIYRLHQICIAPFSNSRSILSHPVTTETNKATSVSLPRIRTMLEFHIMESGNL